MTVRRAKLVAAIAAVPLAVWLVYFLSFSLWTWIRPDAGVRWDAVILADGTVTYRVAPTVESAGYVIFEEHADGSAQTLSGCQAGAWPEDRTSWWGQHSCGVLFTRDRHSAVHAIAAEGEWKPLRDGDEMQLAQFIRQDGSEFTLTIRCCGPGDPLYDRFFSEFSE